MKYGQFILSRFPPSAALKRQLVIIMRLSPIISSVLKRRRTNLLIFAVAVAILCYIALIRYTTGDVRTEELKFPTDPILMENSDPKVISSQGLNGHIWYDVCPSSIEAVCDYPLFPKAPNEKTVITTLDVRRDGDNYIQRIFGFLHPPLTGKYRFALAADDFSELWLSPNEDPSKAVFVCGLNKFTERGEFQRGPSQMSREIELQQNHKYYMEIIHVQLGGNDFFHLVWRLPAVGNILRFSTVPIESTSFFFNPNSETQDNYHKAPISAVCESKSNHQHSSKPDVKSIPMHLPHNEVKDVLPYCDYKPSYLTKEETSDSQPPKRIYKFLHRQYLPVESFPSVTYKNVINLFASFGDHRPDILAAQKAAKLFLDSLHQRYPGYVL